MSQNKELPTYEKDKIQKRLAPIIKKRQAARARQQQEAQKELKAKNKLTLSKIIASAIDTASTYMFVRSVLDSEYKRKAKIESKHKNKK